MSEGREALLRQLLDAESREQVKAAREAGRRWLAEHPDDERVMQAMESIVMADTAHEERGERPA